MVALDKFGISMLNTTKIEGKEYFSTSFNSPTRVYEDTATQDLHDHDLFYRLTTCNGNIQGGEMEVCGAFPGIHVGGPWLNAEFTCYVKVLTSVEYVHLGLRSNIEEFDKNSNRCGFGRYIAKFDQLGLKTAIGKEAMSPIFISADQNETAWTGFTVGQWYGLKGIIQTDRLISNRVLVQGWLDTTGGVNGGTWVKKAEWFDTGVQAVDTTGLQSFIDACLLTDDRNTTLRDPLLDSTVLSSTHLTQKWLEPSRHCSILCKNATKVVFKWISCREINYLS